MGVDYHGVVGHIKCPEVKIHPGKPNVVVVSLTFERDESAAESGKDSYVKHSTMHEDQIDKVESLVINDWIFSWECNVGVKDIDNVMLGKCNSPQKMRVSWICQGST